MTMVPVWDGKGRACCPKCGVPLWFFEKQRHPKRDVDIEVWICDEHGPTMEVRP